MPMRTYAYAYAHVCLCVCARMLTSPCSAHTRTYADDGCARMLTYDMPVCDEAGRVRSRGAHYVARMLTYADVR
jgi:hypothetical protein